MLVVDLITLNLKVGSELPEVSYQCAKFSSAVI